MVFQFKNAIGVGAMSEELIEAGFLAVLMHGGPAMMHTMPLPSAANEFAAAAV